MALVSTGEFCWPNPALMSYGYNAAGGNQRFQASTTRVGFIFAIPPEFDGALVDTVGFRIGTAATPNEIRAGLYTVSSGVPTTTGYDGGGNNYGSTTPTANTDHTITLSRNVTLTGGELCALMFEPHDADAVDMYLGRSSLIAASQPPQMARYVASWTYPEEGICAAIKTTGGVVVPVPGLANINAWGPLSYSTSTGGTTGDENANKITVPFKCRVVGSWTTLYQVGGARKVLLYSGTTVLAEGVEVPNALIGVRTFPAYFMLQDPVTLNAGDTIRICHAPTSTTSIYQYYATMPANSWVGQHGFPAGSCRSYRADAGSWTDVDTDILCCGLIIDQVDDGAGSGGGLITHPGMAGGLRG